MASKKPQSSASAAKAAGFKIPKNCPPGAAPQTEEVRGDKKRHRSQTATVAEPCRKSRVLSSGYDPRATAEPLGAQKRPEVDPDNDLEGLQNALRDMDPETRKKNFELAMKNGDDMATVYASTEEEMQRARALIVRQVRHDGSAPSAFFSSTFPAPTFMQFPNFTTPAASSQSYFS